MRTKTVSIVVPPGVQLTDVSGPLDVFAEANAQTEREAYRLEVIGMAAGPLRSSSGVKLLSDRVVGTPSPERSHTLLVAGAPKLPDLHPTKSLLDWLRTEATRARRYGSVCSGAFLLAAAGLLDDRRATTHWGVADRLANEFSRVTVERDALYVCDGPVRTAAGVTAGMDLALALVEEDLGREIAMRVASQLVMFFRRPGGQLQFSRGGAAVPMGRSAIQELQRWVAAHPAEDLSVPRLATRLGLSPRHFTRLFTTEIGLSPAAWVEAARVEAARRLLEQNDMAPKQAALQCGFADADTMRRAFYRRVGITPAEYRRQFRQGHTPY